MTMKKTSSEFSGKNDRMVDVKSTTSKKKVTRILGVKIVSRHVWQSSATSSILFWPLVRSLVIFFSQVECGRPELWCVLKEYLVRICLCIHVSHMHKQWKMLSVGCRGNWRFSYVALQQSSKVSLGCRLTCLTGCSSILPRLKSFGVHLRDVGISFQLVRYISATQQCCLWLPFVTLEFTWMLTSQWLHTSRQLSEHVLQRYDRYVVCDVHCHVKPYWLWYVHW